MNQKGHSTVTSARLPTHFLGGPGHGVRACAGMGCWPMRAWGAGLCGHGVLACAGMGCWPVRAWGAGLCGPRCATLPGGMRYAAWSPPRHCTHQANLWPTHKRSSVWRVCTSVLPCPRSRALLCPAYTGYCHAFVPGSHQGSVIKASSGSSIVYIPTMYHHHHHQ